MSSQLDRWCGDFGAAYTDRNVVDWRTRVEGFRQMIPRDVDTVLEAGCNRGHNLKAIHEVLPEAIRIGLEPNTYAREQCDTGLVYPWSIYEATQASARFGRFDLTFTSGVLIHVPPERLTEALLAMVAASRRYVLAIEYAGHDETVPYRGHEDMLWRRDYGAHYRRVCSELYLIEAGANVPGFDGATYWLLEKP